jgi:hypothetical protein
MHRLDRHIPGTMDEVLGAPRKLDLEKRQSGLVSARSQADISSVTTQLASLQRRWISRTRTRRSTFQQRRR